MNTAAVAHASLPTAEEGATPTPTTTTTKHRKEKKPTAGEHHHSHDRKHKHSKRSKTGDTVLTTAAGSHTHHPPPQDEGDEDWEENRAAVERLCAQYPNNVCCDCGESGTRWASVNHGVFVCIRCSGVHRSLGTHVSKVKSTNMDRWSLAEVRLMEAIGNAKAKTLYESRLPAGTRPTLSSSSNGGVADEALKSFIQRKYVGRDFAMHNLKDVLGRLYKDTGYGRPPKKSGKAAETSASASSAAREDTRVDRAAISGRRGDTMRALYGEAAEDMQRGAAKRKKGGGGASAAADAAAAAADAAPKPTYGAFGLVNVPQQDYEERWRRTLEAFAHVETVSTVAAAAAAAAGASVAEKDLTPPLPEVAAAVAVEEKEETDEEAARTAAA